MSEQKSGDDSCRDEVHRTKRSPSPITGNSNNENKPRESSRKSTDGRDSRYNRSPVRRTSKRSFRSKSRSRSRNRRKRSASSSSSSSSRRAGLRSRSRSRRYSGYSSRRKLRRSPSPRRSRSSVNKLGGQSLGNWLLKLFEPPCNPGQLTHPPVPSHEAGYSSGYGRPAPSYGYQQYPPPPAVLDVSNPYYFSQPRFFWPGARARPPAPIPRLSSRGYAQEERRKEKKKEKRWKKEGLIYLQESGVPPVGGLLPAPQVPQSAIETVPAREPEANNTSGTGEVVSLEAKQKGVAQELMQQKQTLSKEREEYLIKSVTLSQELQKLKEQKKNLLRDNIAENDQMLRENSKHQSEIQQKLKAINNVIEMFSQIIVDRVDLNEFEKTLLQTPDKVEKSKLSETPKKDSPQNPEKEEILILDISSDTDSPAPPPPEVAPVLIQQKKTLSKEREEYLIKTVTLNRELQRLKEQTKDLQRGESAENEKILRQNAKQQDEIEQKLEAAQNVIEIFSQIIGDRVDIKEFEKSLRKTPDQVEKSRPSETSRKASLPKTEKEEIFVISSDKDFPPPPSPRETPPVKRSSTPPSRFLSASSPSANIVHYDPQLHWCSDCNTFPNTAGEFLIHLHSEQHKKILTELKKEEHPWHKLKTRDKTPPPFNEKLPIKTIPIKGLQFFVPAVAWFCKLCNVWVGDLHCASNHLKDDRHNKKFTEFIGANPHWEVDWLSERSRAYEKSSVEEDPAPVPMTGAPGPPPDMPFSQQVLETLATAFKDKKSRKSKRSNSSSSSFSSSSSEVSPKNNLKKKNKKNPTKKKKELSPENSEDDYKVTVTLAKPLESKIKAEEDKKIKELKPGKVNKGEREMKLNDKQKTQEEGRDREERREGGLKILPPTPCKHCAEMHWHSECPRAQKSNSLPPTPCKYCSKMHWHSECPRTQRSSRSRSPAPRYNSREVKSTNERRYERRERGEGRRERSAREEEKPVASCDVARDRRRGPVREEEKPVASSDVARESRWGPVREEEKPAGSCEVAQTKPKKPQGKMWAPGNDEEETETTFEKKVAESAAKKEIKSPLMSFSKSKLPFIGKRKPLLKKKAEKSEEQKNEKEEADKGSAYVPPAIPDTSELAVLTAENVPLPKSTLIISRKSFS